MKKIGLISDTHSFVNPKIYDFLKDVDEIWHAGDIGNIAIADEINIFKPIRAVYGNMDGHDVRIAHPKYHIFKCENVKVVMTHIGGYPGKYDKEARMVILKERPKLFISGHSHILKVMYDKKYKLLHMNPGAAGNSGIHNSITMIRFEIEGSDIKNLEVLDIPR